MKVKIFSGWLGLSFWLFVVMSILNLTGIAEVPWFWVFSALWIPIVGIVAIFGLLAIISGVAKE